jgi:lactoylglutathione lyase
MPHVCMIQISVSDLDKAIEWYSTTLGFEVSKKHYHHPVAVDLVHKGIRLLLHIADKPTTIDYPNVSQTLICIQTDNIVRKMDDLKRRGVEVLHETPQEFPAGQFIAFRDPFGNVHELVELKS